MGYPQIIHFGKIFHYKPSSYWGTPIPGTSRALPVAGAQALKSSVVCWMNSLVPCWPHVAVLPTKGESSLNGFISVLFFSGTKETISGFISASWTMIIMIIYHEMIELSGWTAVGEGSFFLLGYLQVLIESSDLDTDSTKIKIVNHALLTHFFYLGRWKPYRPNTVAICSL